MNPWQAFNRIAAGFAVLVAAHAVSAAYGQLIRAPLTDGFERTSSIEMTVDEMLGPRKVRQQDEPIVGPGYPALWISEIQYKPVRMLRLQVTDPSSGVTHRELVWYQIYRIIPREYTELAGDGQADLIRKLSDPTRDPENSTDSVRARPIQIPRFVLHTTDETPGQTYMDEVNLEIQKAVFAREMGDRAAGLTLLNSVEAIAEVREPVSSLGPDADRNALESALYGVAVWRNVDPRTDYFTVTIQGLSNAYRVVNDGGNSVVQEKVVVQKYMRPGDEFLQDEGEFRLVDGPVWQYQPTTITLQVPDIDTILRNTRREAGAEAR